MEGALQNGHIEVYEWLLRNCVEIECPSHYLGDAISFGILRIIKAMYSRREFESWPRPAHATILAKLFRSSDSKHQSILDYIVSTRRDRYDEEAVINPYNSTDDFVMVPGQLLAAITSVTMICKRHSISDDSGRIISEFVGGNPDQMHMYMDVIARGWSHWLFSFSGQPSPDLQLLIDYGNFVPAPSLHERVKEDDRLICSKRFMFVTVEKGDLPFIKWHMHHCNSHSVDDWPYAAVWVGRQDVIDWMRQNQPVITASPESTSFKMFHSLDAPFKRVADGFEAELMQAEAVKMVMSWIWQPSTGVLLSRDFGDSLQGCCCCEVYCVTYSYELRYPTLRTPPEASSERTEVGRR